MENKTTELEDMTRELEVSSFVTADSVTFKLVYSHCSSW